MMFVSDASLPLPGMPDSTPTPPAFQMTLIGQPQPVRIPERLWRSWLDDPAVVLASSPSVTAAGISAGPGSAGCHRPGMVRSGRRACPGRPGAGPCRRGAVPAHLFA